MLRHGGGGGVEASLELKNRNVGGVLTLFISKNRLKSLFLKQLHNISSCNIYIHLNMFSKQNISISEN